jgi:hypothetical protein
MRVCTRFFLHPDEQPIPRTSWFITVVDGLNSWMWFPISKHPAYVGVGEEHQLQFVLDQAFIEAAIAMDSGVALNKDSSTTTICVKEEYQHHKQCQRICPSLRIFNFHFSQCSCTSLTLTSYLIFLLNSFTHIL